MKILFNSDLLFVNSLIRDKLPQHISFFLLECKENGHEIIIPLTTLLEFEKKQSDFANKEISDLKNAVSKLTEYGIKFDECEPSKIVKQLDLIQLIKDIGVPCSLENPTNLDYENAHRRACLKESPHPPDKKSDEMRDPVIWEISLRIAKENNGAILMSRDEVHAHHRGDKEASSYGLIRCNSIERAFESLSIETVSANEIKELIGKVWGQIIGSILPVVDGGQVVSIKNPIFQDTDQGSSKVTCNIQFDSGDGKKLAALLHMEYVNDQPFALKFRDIKIDEAVVIEDIDLNFEKPTISNVDLNERMNNLRELMGE